MPQVASETPRVLNRPHSYAVRPPQADRASSTPFAKLLDDTAATDSATPQAADPSQQGANSLDNATQTGTPDAAQKPQQTAKTGSKAGAKSDVKSDVKSEAKTGAKSNGQAVADAAKTDATVEPDTALATDAEPTDGKTATDGKIMKTKGAGDKPVDAKLAETLPDPSATQPVAPAQPVKTPVTTATPIAIPLVPAPAAAPAHIADNDPAPAPTVDAVTAALQGDAGKSADALTAKTAAARGEAKPQGPATVANDTAVPRAHGQPSDGDPAIATQTLAAPVSDAATASTLPDLPQPAALAAAAQAGSAAASSPTVAAQQMPQAAAIPLSGVAVEIASKASSGNNSFEIRLDPPELGRIEVRLNVDHEGNVSARMIADRADTLDLLRRDASGLQNALQDAGLKTSDNSLQFSLRDQSASQQQQQQQQQQTSQGSSQVTQLVVNDETLPPAITTRSYSRLAGLGDGVDIHV